MKTHKSNISDDQQTLVMERTSKKVLLMTLPSQNQTKYFEKRNAQLIAAQQKDPARQRQKELCRQLFANLPAYVEDDDNLKYFDDEPRKKTKSKRKVASESSSIPEWEKQQIEKSKLLKEARYRNMGFNPDEETIEQGAETTGANQSGAGWPADENGNVTTISTEPDDNGENPVIGPITEYDNETYGNEGAWGRDRTGDGGGSGGGNPGKPQTIYTWDEENRLAQAETKGKTVKFAYGSGGQRVYKHSSDGETAYSDSMWSVRLSSNPVLEYKSIYLGSERLLTKLGTGNHNSGDNSYQKINSYYYHTNHLGSVNTISDYRGDEFEYREYTPYGEEWINEETDPAHSANMGLEPGFTGHIEDKETGLVYANARYYEPKISRFMSSDPAMDGLNWYGYARNNPITYNDPSGLLTVKGDQATIEEGDTLYKISQETGVSMEDLAKANGIDDINAIKKGATLKIPGQSSGSEESGDEESSGSSADSNQGSAPANSSPAAPQAPQKASSYPDGAFPSQKNSKTGAVVYPIDCQYFSAGNAMLEAGYKPVTGETSAEELAKSIHTWLDGNYSSYDEKGKNHGHRFGVMIKHFFGVDVTVTKLAATDALPTDAPTMLVYGQKAFWNDDKMNNENSHAISYYAENGVGTFRDSYYWNRSGPTLSDARKGKSDKLIGEGDPTATSPSIRKKYGFAFHVKK